VGGVAANQDFSVGDPGSLAPRGSEMADAVRDAQDGHLGAVGEGDAGRLRRQPRRHPAPLALDELHALGDRHAGREDELDALGGLVDAQAHAPGAGGNANLQRNVHSETVRRFAAFGNKRHARRAPCEFHGVRGMFRSLAQLPVLTYVHLL
jgi:hypothetical protein